METGCYVGLWGKQAHYEQTNSALSFGLFLTFYEYDAASPNFAILFVFVTSWV
jgi:hypothetical protein